MNIAVTPVEETADCYQCWVLRQSFNGELLAQGVRHFGRGHLIDKLYDSGTALFWRIRQKTSFAIFGKVLTQCIPFGFCQCIAGDEEGERLAPHQSAGGAEAFRFEHDQITGHELMVLGAWR